jgi:hypothetical protein
VGNSLNFKIERGIVGNSLNMELERLATKKEESQAEMMELAKEQDILDRAFAAGENGTRLDAEQVDEKFARQLVNAGLLVKIVTYSLTEKGLKRWACGRKARMEMHSRSRNRSGGIR